jgi:hypothetical protein
MNLFNSFEQWRAAITGPCGITLTQDYCEGRVRALNNPAEPSTKAFVEAYGETYRTLVVSWFDQAARHANG